MSALHFHSPPRPDKSSNKQLFEYLTDFRNFSQLLPADRISDFKVDGDSCSFNIQGIAALKVVLEKKRPCEEILYHISGPAKSDLRLKITFTGDSGQGSSAVELAAHLNPFLKVMAEKPLKSLVNTIAEKLAALTL